MSVSLNHQVVFFLAEIFRGAPGFGFSKSSARFTLDAAIEYFLRTGRVPGPLDHVEIISSALWKEQQRAGRLVGGQDVCTIVTGRVCRTLTYASGAVVGEPVSHDPEFIRSHVLLAIDPHGERHDIPTALAKLFGHPQRREFVKRISDLAELAAASCAASELVGLARAMNRYRVLKDQWSGHRFVRREVRQMAHALARSLGRGGLLAWKPPGGGSASSLILLVGEAHGDKAIRFLTSQGWIAERAVVSEGLRVAPDGDVVRFSCPHRADMVGAADLSRDPSIATAGVCLSIAVEPRDEWIAFRRPDLLAGGMPAHILGLGGPGPDLGPSWYI
jgi:hypothetical protein